MERHQGPIVHDGALYHDHTAGDSANPDEEMLENAGSDDEWNDEDDAMTASGDEQDDDDEAMTPINYNFSQASEAGEAGAATPRYGQLLSTQQQYAERGPAFESSGTRPETMSSPMPGPSTDVVHMRPSDTYEAPTKKARPDSDSMFITPGFERGSSKRRSGQTRHANRQLVKTLGVKEEQHQRDLITVRNDIKAQYQYHVQQIKEEAKKQEQIFQEQLVRCFLFLRRLAIADRHCQDQMSSVVAENREAAKAEKERASQTGPSDKGQGWSVTRNARSSSSE